MNIQLVLDESSVSAAEGVSFHLNQATKHPENPVLLPGEPHQWDSLQVSWPAIVLHDPDDGLFRCWYSGLDAVQADRPPVPWQPAYAESEDGIHWTKPELGHHTHRELGTNRLGTDWDAWIVFPVFPNPDQSDPQRRFLGFWKDHDTYYAPGRPLVLASSADGKMWYRETSFPRPPDVGPTAHDYWQVLYEPDASDPDYRYLVYSQLYIRARSWDGKLVRQIGLAHGPKLTELRSADPIAVLEPDEGIDEELHFASVFKTGGNYLMLFESDRFSQKPLHGDLRLAISSDGRSFRRVHPHTPVLPTGAKGTWDENLLVTTAYAMQEVGDEVWIYYHGCPNVYTNWPPVYAVKPELRGSLFYPVYLGLATLPRDRYAYAAGPGALTSQPLTLTSGELWLNADGDDLSITASSGGDEMQGRLSGERSQTVYRKVIWDGTVPTGETQLRITLNAGDKLYSLKVE